MKERASWPMKAWEVRAILDGRKTQTRRIAKIARVDAHPSMPPLQIVTMAGGRWEQFWLNSQPDHPHHISRACPYGQPGDRLWVRETWHTDEPDLAYARAKHEDAMSGSPICYAADAVHDNAGCIWRPSIRMPRWASRITLEIVSVRVERVQEISEGDCWDEGIEEWLNDDKNLPRYSDGTPSKYINIKQAFGALWDSINAKRAPWSSNPWVWVIEFRRAGE